MPKIKLYTAHASSNSRRVLATAKHVSVELDIITVDTTKGEHKEAAYLKLNPNGKTPTLVDGDFVLWESPAIMQYIAKVSREGTLWPDDAARQADISRWQFWEAAHLGIATGTIVFETLVKPMFLKQKADDATVERAHASLHMFAPVLNDHLSNRAYLVGDALTLADFSVAASFSYANIAPHAYPIEQYRHIRDWLSRLDEVPAWRETAPSM